WRLAETLLAASRPTETESVLSGVSDAGAATYWLPALKARARQALGDRARAIALYGEAVEREPDPSDAALRGGVLLKNGGRVEEARRLVDRALERGARRASLLELAGDLAAEAGDTGRAEAHYREAVRRNPTGASAWTSLARTAFATSGGPPD